MSMSDLNTVEIDVLKVLSFCNEAAGLRPQGIKKILVETKTQPSITLAEVSVVIESLFRKGFIGFWNCDIDKTLADLVDYGMRINLVGYQEIDKRNAEDER